MGIFPEGETIYQSDHYRIDYFPAVGHAKGVVVTFSERTARNLDGYGFGAGFMLNHGFALIAVKGCRDNWYQDFPDDAVAAVQRRLSQSDIDGLPISTYGSSMGAYAAVALSGVLRADAVLAISPLVSTLLSWDERWRDDVHAFRPLDDIEVSRTCRIVLAYDPTDLDARHADIVAKHALEHHEKVLVPFAGHPVGRELQNAGCLKELALAVFNGEALPDVSGSLKRRRRASTDYAFGLARKCRDSRKFRWGLAVSKVGLSSDPFHPELNIQAATIAVALESVEDAIRFASMAVVFRPSHPDMIAYLSVLLKRAGKSDVASLWLDRAMSLRPGDVGLEALRPH